MLSTGGGVQPRWDRNGKEVFYFSGSKLMAIDRNILGEMGLCGNAGWYPFRVIGSYPPAHRPEGARTARFDAGMGLLSELRRRLLWRRDRRSDSIRIGSRSTFRQW